MASSCSMRARMRSHSSHVDDNQPTPGVCRLRGKVISNSTVVQLIPARSYLSFTPNLFSVFESSRRMLDLCLITALRAKSAHAATYSRG